MQRVILLLTWASASLAGTVSPAQADVVVIESYGGSRPADAADVLAPLYEQFGVLGYAADSEALAGRVEARVSRPGSVLSGAELVETIDLVDRGYDRWLAGEFAGAAEDLSAALSRFRDRPATVAVRIGHRDAVFKALVGLALARARVGDVEGATAAMVELLRSFPDREISRADYGPEPRSLYRHVKEELDERSRGTLRVRPDDAAVVVFVNGRYAGVGDLTLADLYPGRYRIFVRRGNDPGRVHEVDIAPNVEQTLSLTWGLEASLRTRTEYVGFEFADEAARQASEADYATTVARRIDATGVVVVGIRRYRGRRSIVGTVLDLDTGKPVRTGAIAIEPAVPSDDSIRALASFLGGGDAAPGILVEGALEPTDAGVARSASVWPWLVVGSGVIALAGGAALIAIDDPQVEDGDQQPSARDSRVPGMILAAGGAVLTGTGIYLWLRGRRDRPRTETSVVPIAGQRWGLAVVGRF